MTPSAARRFLSLFCVAVLFPIFLQSLCAQGRDTPQQKTAGTSPVLSINTPGQPLVELGGPWQFHLGDDPRWALPDTDDSKWATISTDKGWDVQGYPDTGRFAWYRRHLHFTSSGTPAEIALMPLNVQYAGEVFWNGVLIGSCGQLPPHEKEIFCWNPIRLPRGTGTADGVLALRVWSMPSYGLASPGSEGMQSAPQLGSSPAVDSANQAHLYQLWRERRAQVILAALYAVACMLAFVAYASDRRDPLYFYLASFLASVVFRFSIYLWMIFGGLSWALEQELLFVFGYALGFSMLWLLLLQLFNLSGSYSWRNITRTLIYVSFLLSLLFTLYNHSFSFLTHKTALFFRVDFWGITLIELYTIVLVAAGMKRTSDAINWAVAVTSTIAIILPAFYNVLQLLRHWDYADKYLVPTLFTFFGGAVTAEELSRFLLLVALVFAAIRRLQQSRRRRTETEMELLSAREVQHVLMPDELPEVPGFALASAYYPAKEVGGDFFQVIPLASQSTLVLLGDVSGKGLRAGMMVALITGAARTAAETDSGPGAVLASINRRLCGRMQGGFATAIALLAHPDGNCIVANAGHLNPLLNGNELAFAGALPLGIDPDAAYASELLTLQTGDVLTLYSDGVPEARNKRGELLGFDRTASLVAEFKGAEAIARQAQTFGQEDDITVLTIERTGAHRIPNAA